MEEKRATVMLTVGVGTLLVMLLYIGSYLTIVRPGKLLPSLEPFGDTPPSYYRIGGRYAATLYLPLEWIDRRLRHRQWEDPWEIEGR